MVWSVDHVIWYPWAGLVLVDISTAAISPCCINVLMIWSKSAALQRIDLMSWRLAILPLDSLSLRSSLRHSAWKGFSVPTPAWKSGENRFLSRNWVAGSISDSTKASVECMKPDEKNRAIAGIARSLEKNVREIEAANRLDLERARQENLAAPLLKRLRFDEAKISEACVGLRSLEALEDPVGRTLRAVELDHRYGGLRRQGGIRGPREGPGIRPRHPLRGR